MLCEAVSGLYCNVSLVPDLHPLTFLQILQLADSGLPVGSISHSFGLESMVADQDIEDGVAECPASLHCYLDDCLSEGLLVDAAFCREAHIRGRRGDPLDDLNQQASALKVARETRNASLSMGRRFAALAAALDHNPALAALSKTDELHHSVAFGFILGVLGIDSNVTVSAFVHQSVISIISAAQRLLPLGQTEASRLAWRLKDSILRTAAQSQELSYLTVTSFAHLPEMASMRHSRLGTRLFIS